MGGARVGEGGVMQIGVLLRGRGVSGRGGV